MKIEVSIGEVIDKITILQIKQEKIKDKNKLKYISEELETLSSSLKLENISVPSEMVDELKRINLELWEAEDIIRDCENRQDFGDDFVMCARLDAILNDKRFLAKNKINNYSNSVIKEQKSYEGLYTSD